MKFGFINDPNPYYTHYVNIFPVSDLSDRVQDIESTYLIENGWLYPPLEESQHPSQSRPHIWYDLPPSHDLQLVANNRVFPETFLNFIGLFFGFLKSMQFLPLGHGRFYRTPYIKNKLTGFIVVCDSDFTKIIDTAAEFFLANSENGIANKYYAALFWFLFGQSYMHAFEKFDAQYRVLDCIWNIYENVNKKKRNLPHAERLVTLCEHYALPVPAWGIVSADTPNEQRKPSSIVANLRNRLVHEALFAGEPIGYKLPAENFGFEFPRLNERLLLALIGIHPRVFSRPIDYNLLGIRLS
jgi:hypothetical protein